MVFKRLLTTKVAIVLSLITVGGLGGSLASVEGSSAAVPAKVVTCGDAIAGVTDGPWTVVCSGTAVAGASVTLEVTPAGALRATATVTNTITGATISYVDVSFNSTGGTASLLVSQVGVPDKIIDVAATKAGGGVVTVKATETAPSSVRVAWY